MWGSGVERIPTGHPPIAVVNLVITTAPHFLMLSETSHRVGRQALRTGLCRHGRKALQPKSFVPRTTDSTHGQRCAPNLLRDQPRPTQANRVWESDITCLPLASGAWAYLCAFQDLCTKHVVGWQVRADMPETLVTSALQRALLAQRPAPGLIVHSDRGGQYVGNAYKALLRDAQAQLSHSRRGECWRASKSVGQSRSPNPWPPPGQAMLAYAQPGCPTLFDALHSCESIKKCGAVEIKRLSVRVPREESSHSSYASTDRRWEVPHTF